MRRFPPSGCLSAWALWLLLAASLAAAAEPAASAFIPGDFDVYLELNDLRTHRKAFLASAFWAKLQKTRFYADVKADAGLKFVQHLREGWKSTFGRSLEETFDDIIGVQAAVGLRFTGAGEPEGILVGRGSSQEALRQLLDRLTALRAGAPQAADYAGARIVRFDEQFIAVRKDRWFAADKEALLKAALDLAAGKATDSLESRPAFTQAISDLPADAVGRFYIDLKQVLARQPTPADPAGRRITAVFASARSLAVGLTPGPRSIRAEFVLRADAGGFHPVLSALLGPEPAESTLLKICPPDTFVAAAVALDTAAVRRALEDAAPELKMDDGYQIFAETFYAGYVEKLGPEFALIVRRGEFDGPAPAARLPGVALAARLKDPGVARSITDQARAFANLARFKARKDGLEIVVKEAPYKDVPLLSVDIDALLRKRKDTEPLAGALRPCLAQVGDYLVFGLHDSVVRAVIDAHAGGPNLASDPGFAAVMHGLPSRNSGWTYVSFARLADALAENRAVLLAAPPAPGAAPESPASAAARFDAGLELLRLFENAAVVRVNRAGRARQTLVVRAAE
jgi:hypothetical protein